LNRLAIFENLEFDVFFEERTFSTSFLIFSSERESLDNKAITFEAA